MEKKIVYWQMGGFLFTAVAGTLLHFLFDWTGGSVAAGLISAVNESIWEHLKLLLYPMIAVAVAEYFVWGKENGSFWCVKLLGILAGFLLIVGVYYTYTGVFGVNADWLNITLFFLAAALVYRLETKLLAGDFSCRIGGRTAFLMILLLVGAFTVFTFATPEIPLFRDPVTGTYGFQG
jgi:hypothetical protein